MQEQVFRQRVGYAPPNNKKWVLGISDQSACFVKIFGFDLTECQTDVVDYGFREPIKNVSRWRTFSPCFVLGDRPVAALRVSASRALG